MKRLISLTMASLMVGSLLPMSAFGAAADGWHYEGIAGIINKTERQQANGDSKIGVNWNDTDMYSGKYDEALDGASDTLDPWEIATANAPEVQIKLASVTTFASGSFDTSSTGKPYIISEFDIVIEDAVLVKWDVETEEVTALDEYDILHLISITRDIDNSSVKTSVRDILHNTNEGYDAFPDIYVTNLSKRTVGGVNGVSSFRVELRSHADGNVAFVDDTFIEDDELRTSTDYSDKPGTPIPVYKYDAKNVESNAKGTASSNQFVSGTLLKNDIISIKLPTYMKSSTRSTANISVISDDFQLNDSYNYASLVDTGMSLSYTRGLDAVAQEEAITLSGDIVIKETIAGAFDPSSLKPESNKVTFKLNKGFEFYFPGRNDYDAISTNLLTNLAGGTYYSADGEWDQYGTGHASQIIWEDQYDEFSMFILNGLESENGVYAPTGKSSEFTVSSSILETLRIDATTYDATDGGIEDGGIGIKATTAGVGDVAAITVVIDGVGYGTIEVAEVVDYLVILEVDSSADVPVMFSGVNRDNDGLTTDHNNNYSLEVTIRETFPGAWDMTDGFAIRLPEEVYVVNDEDYTGYDVQGYDRDGGGVIVIDVNNLKQNDKEVTRADLYNTMEAAYRNGNYTDFEFGRRPFDSTDVTLSDEVASMTFQLVLTASYGFEGPVELGLQIYGCEDDIEPVVIAEFVKPFEVGATGNDVIIDYRDTLLATNLTFVEYEAGLLTSLGTYPQTSSYQDIEYVLEKPYGITGGSNDPTMEELFQDWYDKIYGTQPESAEIEDESEEELPGGNSETDQGDENSNNGYTDDSDDYDSNYNPSYKRTNDGYIDKNENYFSFNVDRGDYIQFEGANFNINTDDSDAEFRSWSGYGRANSIGTASSNFYYDVLYFYLGEESRNVPMSIEIDNIELFMQRSIPAGTYSLSLTSKMLDAMKSDRIFGGHWSQNSYDANPSDDYSFTDGVSISVGSVYRKGGTTVDSDWINVITAGSDKDNAFLTKIVVPIGSSTVYTSARTIDLNATEGGATPPAYINANNWTMVPVRAVTEALGDSGIMVTWDNDAKAVGIIYPDRVISITLGDKFATVNGTKVPLNESLEMVDNRVFLPFRDLGNLLGVSNADINYDAVSRTAIINGSVDDIASITGNAIVATAPTTEVEEVVTEEVTEEVTTTEEEVVTEEV